MDDTNNLSERKPFLIGQKPATFSQSWEEQKLSNEELNFKESKMEKLQTAPNPPKDTYLVVFFIFVLHGIGTLMPWNVFITAKSYFVDFKLASNNTESNELGSNFLHFLSFAAQIPNLLFNWLNVFLNLGGDLTKRIVYSILIEIIILIITVILAMINSDEWPEIFFWITIISVFLLNMANGVYQNTIYGMVAILPQNYTGAVVLGSNISGLFTAIVDLVSSLIFTSKRTAAIYYFITAMITLLICFDTYFALPLNKFFRFHESRKRKTEVSEKKDQMNEKIPFWTVFKAASPQLFNVFFTFFVTLAVFPAVYSDIKKSDDEFFIRDDELFTKITCFLTFNLFAMLGSLLTSWIRWPKPNYLVIPVVMRSIFLPLFLFCNYLPKDVERTLPVLITNDWVYWTIAIIMSFSSGYLSSLGMMYTPQIVAPKFQLTAGMFAAAMLITGIFSGVMLSFIFPKIV